ncbi:glycosyl hydrolase family 65 protein [Paenibacillus tuaregi]|uniref:glycosyl hydrolase family 65 protein n=1 Tax=Paenibacillus tuaregi TaxID=1816681 RepID=UPI0008397DE9|nr:glycosyl hydrolase family 65 protein [Paenibacillus tuaregi]
MSWTVRETGYTSKSAEVNGNKFMIGNGRFGYRGTLEEFTKQELTATIVAGLYDQVPGKWREPVNVPNGLATRIYADDEQLSVLNLVPVHHEQELDIRQAVHCRTTTFAVGEASEMHTTGSGGASDNMITFRSERFASLAQLPLLVSKMSLSCTRNCRIVIETGIDGDVWDINGPHLEGSEAVEAGVCIALKAVSQELKQTVVVAESMWSNFGDIRGMGIDAGANTGAESRIATDAGTNTNADSRIATDTHINTIADSRIATNNVTEEIVSEDQQIYRRITVDCLAGETYEWVKYVSIFTGLDPVTDPLQAALNSSRDAREAGYDQLLAEHQRKWDEKWALSDVRIEGDDEAQFALRYSMYQLLIIAPYDSEKVSIPARGLSGQVYKGAVFWDTEMFMLPFFLFTQPEVARNLMMYRVHTLEGARRKAAEYGFEGAFYAWESQDSGEDACTLFNVSDVFTGRKMRTYFRDKQVHISADVVHGIWQYYTFTGDIRLLLEGGARVIWECARFFYSYGYYNSRKMRYEILDVTGPDEYHERVNNNAFTNYMAKRALETAILVMELLQPDYPELVQEILAGGEPGPTVEHIREMHDQLYVPQPGAEDGIVEQFDGYFQLEDASLDEVKSRVIHPNEYWGGGNGIATTTRIIKQADVVLMLHLFKEVLPQEVKKANWAYYEPRTEHGSSLSPCVYALVASDIGSPDWAYPYFMRTATIDLTGDSKQYVGDLYIGGTHPAANGGAWMAAVLGFAGLHYEKGVLHIRPQLPAKWEKISFCVVLLGQQYQIEVSKSRVSVIPQAVYTRKLPVDVFGERRICQQDQAVDVDYGTDRV